MREGGGERGRRERGEREEREGGEREERERERKEREERERVRGERENERPVLLIRWLIQFSSQFSQPFCSGEVRMCITNCLPVISQKPHPTLP